MNIKQAIARATTLCERIAAPDFAPSRRLVRLVPFSVARRWSPRLAGGHCYGWTHPLLDTMLRDHIDLPPGHRAFCCILHDDVLPNEAALVNTALHELAHDLTTLSVPAAVEALGAFRDLTVDSLPPALPPSADEHDERFYRAAAHVAHRSRLAGWSTTLADLQPCRPTILQALGDEPRQRETEPINAILATPAPAAFVRLWHRAAA